MTKNLQEALKVQKKKTQRQKLQLSGTLGIPLGGQRLVEVSGRNSFVYVQLRDNQSEVIQAFNNKVAPSYGLPVIVERQGPRYIVLGVDSLRYQSNWNSFAPYLPRHGNTHSFDTDSGGGGDVAWIHTRQFTPALIFPSGSVGGPNVLMDSYVLKNSDGSWKYIGNTGTPSLLPFRPANNQAVMALVYLDTVSGNPYLMVGSGSYFAATITGTSAVLPYIPSITNPDHIPLAAIRLVSGTNAIGWNNIYDVRQFLHPIITGSSSGGGGGNSSGVTVWDEGISLGLVSILNFVGQGVDVSVSGTVARIHISGSSGGGGDVFGPASSISGSMPIFGNSSGKLLTQFTPTGTYPYINHGGRVDRASASPWKTVPTSSDYLLILDNAVGDRGARTTIQNLATNTYPRVETNSENIFRVANASTSVFVGTIASKSANTLVYNVTSGNENALVPGASTQLGKLVLHCPVRGDFNYITACNTATNTLTFELNVDSAWQVGDTITIASQTVSGGPGNWVDIRLRSGPTGKSALFLNVNYTDTGTITSSTVARIHPFETFGAGKLFAVAAQVSGFSSTAMVLTGISSDFFTISWEASGAGTATLIIREMGYFSL